MSNTKIRTTVQIPSGFGMPACGHAFRVTTDARTTATALVMRERAGNVWAAKGATDGDLGLAQSYIPGTSAWRPPTC